MASTTTEYNTLPISKIIGAPLLAACDSQVLLAKSTEKFIKEVGFDNNGSASDQPRTRMVDFSFIRAVQDVNGNIIDEKVNLQVPMLAIVNIPSLSIKSVDVVFDIEIKSAEQSKGTKDYSDEEDDKAMPATGELQVYGKVAAHQENTRSTDTSSKYHVQVHAEKDDTPEGLARVLDIIASSIAPRRVEVVESGSTQPQNQTEHLNKPNTNDNNNDNNAHRNKNYNNNGKDK